MKNALTFAALIGLVLCPISFADDFSSLEERMTGREFRDAGLHKLSDSELSALNRWIQERSLAEGQSLTSPRRASAGGTGPDTTTDRRGLPDANNDDSPIEARIVGSFNGWNGSTVFELDNGMVWEQIDGKAFGMAEMENPQVTIEPGFWGSWRLRVDGYNARAQVRRIR